MLFTIFYAMKKILILTLILPFFVTCVRLTNSDDKEPVSIALSANQTVISKNGNLNSWALLSLIAQDQLDGDKVKNTVISTLSLNIALAMTWNGAEGETKAEIQRFLGLGDLSEEEVNDYFKQMLTALPEIDPKVTLSIANSIWYNNWLKVYSSFKQANSNYFFAEVTSLNFGDPESLNTINNWCSNKTNGIIKKVLDNIRDDEVMFLINALYFKAPWTIKFDKSKTINSPFYPSEGAAVSAPMMTNTDTFVYSENQGYKTLKLDYGDSAFSIILILPDVDKDINSIVLAVNNPEVWNSIYTHNYTSRVDVKIPRFKFEYNIELNKHLKELGVKKAFNGSESELNKIADVGSEKLYISRILQKAAIEVNEEGSEAAAVTVVGIGVTSVPMVNTFHAERPFIFAITENSTGTILFAGKVENPLLSN